MALSGTLKTLSLSEIFQTLERSNAVGVLRLISIDGAKDIVFNDGNIINVVNKVHNSNLSIAQRISASGGIQDQSIIDEITESADGYATVSGLVALGVEKNFIDHTIESHMLDELYDIFTWEQANFTFLELGSADDDDGEVQELIDESQTFGIAIKTNTVLMESARRLDEWSRARESIPDNNVVLNVTVGSESRLQKMLMEYPARVIVPLINGQNSLEEIIEESIATRMDVCLTVADLIDEQLAVVLTSEQIVANAKQFENSSSFEQAAALYRRALAGDPENTSIREALASSLEQHGDGPQAAGCYAELAMGYLREGDLNQACMSAERAVEIGGEYQERQVLIQCLESAGKVDEATEQMRRLAEYHIFHSQWDEAREICHQVLTVDPNDSLSLHLMSLGFIHTCDLGLKESEVACVFCDQVNSRKFLDCENCHAHLHKLCRNCHSETACSDRVCLFCGKSPHILENDEVDSGLFASLNEEDSQHRTRIQEAVDLRNVGKLDQALAIWKGIAQENSSNQQIYAHIRELESDIHDQSIEHHISKGNGFRRGRRFGRAVKAYSEALRILSPRDTRKARLEAILVACKTEHKRTSVIYAVVGFALAMTLFLLVEPLVRYSNYRKQVEASVVTISNQVNAGGGLQTFLQVQTQIAELREAGIEFGDKTKDAEFNLLSIELESARVRLSMETVVEIQAAVKEMKIQKALEMLRSFKRGYGPECNKQTIEKLTDKIAVLSKEQKEIASQLAHAADLFASALQLKQNNQFIAALTRFKALAESPDEKVRTESITHRDGLLSAQNTLNKKLDAVDAAIARNLSQALKDVTAIKNDAKMWGAEDQWKLLDKRVHARITLAEKRIAKLLMTGSEAELQKYLTDFPGSTYQQQAQERMNDLGNERAAQAKARTRLQSARDSKNWNILYQQSLRFRRNFPQDSAELQFPLQLTTVPSGAAVLIGGKKVGTTPYVHHYAWNAQDDLSIELAGFDSELCSTAQQRNDWQYTVHLSKSVVLQKNISSGISAMYMHNGTLLACGTKSIVFCDVQGKELANYSVGELGFLSDNIRKWTSFIGVQDEGVVVPIDANRVVLYNWSGERVAEYALTQDIESRPLLYVNELFGGGLRVALSDGGLAIGNEQGAVNRIEKEHRVIAGPVSVSDDDLNQVLVYLSHLGLFIAYDEGTSSIVWSQDSGAADVSSLSHITGNHYLAVLDDSRLARFEFSLTGVRKVWDRPLKKALIGDPKIIGKRIYIPLDNGVTICDLNGNKRLQVDVTGEVSAVSGLESTGFAIGEKSGRVSFYNTNGEFLWQKQLQSIPQALLVVEKRVYVGTSTGQLFIFEP